MLNIQLYNKLKNTSGYITTNGVIKHDLDAYFVVTDYMQVTPGSKCSYNGITFVGPEQYGAFYGLDQEFISTFTLNTEETEFVVPADVYYVRFSLCRRTKMNLFSSPLEVGSINEVSGSNEAGDEALPYMPYANGNKDDTETFNFFIYGEAYAGFREELYEWIKSTLSPNLTENDLDIIIRLMCYIFGDLNGLVYNLKSQIDPDLAEEAYLQHLGSIIGYEWNNALTAEEQRESMKLYVDLQKKRGTVFSLKNLIAVFGQDKNSYYSTSDLRGVNIIEGGKNGEPVGTEDENGLYPGDIMIEIPQMSSILIDAIDNIRLIGTRIFFTYVIYCGPFKIDINTDAGHELNMFFDPAYWGYDPTIEEFTNLVEEETGSDIIDNVKDWPLLNTRVKNCQANACCAIYTAYKAPFDKGFIWNTPGLSNYQGFLIDDDTLKEDDTMYGYGH